MKRAIGCLIFLGMPWLVQAGFLPKAFTTDFKQSYISMLSSKRKTNDGKISYRYPGNIRYEIDDTLFVSNKKQSWYYVKPAVANAKGEVTIRPAGELPLVKFFDTLKHGLSSNKQYSVEKVGEDYLLQFKKAFIAKSGLISALLRFKKKAALELKNVESVEITKENKQVLTYEFSAFKTPGQQAETDFSFIIPPNTNIVQ